MLIATLLLFGFGAAVALSARVTRCAPQLAHELSRGFLTQDAPWLPAYVMHVNDVPQAALFFDAMDRQMQMQAVHLVYNRDVMCRPGYMTAFRRLVDRSCKMYYEDLSFSDWFTFVATTEVPENDD